MSGAEASEEPAAKKANSNDGAAQPPKRRSPRLAAAAASTSVEPDDDFSLDGGTQNEILSVDAYREKLSIEVTKGSSKFGIPDPMQTFSEAPWEPSLQAAIKQAGYVNPSPIQSQCWPVALLGSDLIAVAKTGSGKTVGFLFPLFKLIIDGPGKKLERGVGPVGCVVAPTRELAIQIEEECVKFGKGSGFVSACVYGGVPKGPQMYAVMKGVHLIVATPGRMNDFLTMKSFKTVRVDRSKP